MSEILDRIYPDNESQLFFTEIADHRKYIIELEQQLQQAHRAGFEEGKKQAVQEIADWLRDDIYSIESKYLQNNKHKVILFFVSDELRQRYGLGGDGWTGLVSSSE